jgi:hypothetical protein
MSDSQGVWLIVLVLIAYAIWTLAVIRRKRNENAKAEQVRALLRPRINEYTEGAKLSAAKDNYFSSAVEDDTAHGRPSEKIDINRRRALEFERQGRSLLLAAKALEEVIRQPTKAEMIAVMERYVLDFGRKQAEQARLYSRAADDREKEQINTEGFQMIS